MTTYLKDTVPSNRDWKMSIEVADADTDDLIDLTGAVVAIALDDQDGNQKVLATTDNGKLTIVSLGVIEMSIPYSEMNLNSGSYVIGGYYQLGGETIDLISGDVTITRGFPRPS